MADTKTLLLQAAAEMRAEDQNGWPVVCDIAVAAIEAHEARIAELEGALRPFAKGEIDVSGAAVIIGYPEAGQALAAARRALHTEGE